MPRLDLRAVKNVSRRVLVVNAILVVAAGLLLATLAREFSRSRPIPPPPAPRPAAQARAASAEPATADLDRDKLDSYNVIVAKHLFNPARAENGSASAAAPAAPPPPKPFLHGVVVDGAASLAYLEDPSTKRVLVYRIGDLVAGGQLLKIEQDRVLIRRPDAQLDVLLKDPAKPQAQPVPVAGQAPTRTNVRDVAQPPQPVRARPEPASPRAGVRTPRLGVEPQPLQSPIHQED
jgi:hypothetical protein